MATNNNEERNPQPPPIPMWLQEHCLRLEANVEDLTNLNLNIRQLNRRWMSSLSHSLAKNYTVLSLNMVSTFSTQSNPNECLVEFTKHVLENRESCSNRNQLQILHLGYNRLTNVGLYLGPSLTQNYTLRQLILDYNYLNLESAISLAEGLKDNATLKVLKLSSNRISDEGGKALGEALQVNETLATLTLARNPLLGMETAKAFLNAFQDANNTTLCQLELSEGNPPIPNSTTLEFYAQANKAGRYLIHYQSNHPNDSMGIWPFVLAQRQPQQTPPTGDTVRIIEPSLTFMFLKERPDLVTTNNSGSTTAVATEMML